MCVYVGGKSDPYFEVRAAFGATAGIPYISPNKDSRGNDLPKKTYKGKHDSQAFLQSEVVPNELNPTWCSHLLQLNELIDFNGGGCVVDLTKRILIDVWDSDRGGESDFMYVAACHVC